MVITICKQMVHHHLLEEEQELNMINSNQDVLEVVKIIVQ